MYRLFLITALLSWAAGSAAQRRLVVASLESKTPQRDVLVRIDNSPEIRTPWNGQIEVPDSFRHISLFHPKFQRRTVRHGELHSDTIFLIPALHAIDEVVIYGERRFDKHMADILRPATPKETPLPQVIPAGPNVLAMLGWIFEHTIGPKIDARHRRKQALKQVRAKEKEYEQRWSQLLPDTTKIAKTE